MKATGTGSRYYRAMTMVDGNTVVDASAAPRQTLRKHATEAKRAGRVLDDRWAIKLFGFFGAVDYRYGKFGSA